MMRGFKPHSASCCIDVEDKTFSKLSNYILNLCTRLIGYNLALEGIRSAVETAYCICHNKA
jgi:hypothetical protein